MEGKISLRRSLKVKRASREWSHTPITSSWYLDHNEGRKADLEKADVSQAPRKMLAYEPPNTQPMATPCD